MSTISISSIFEHFILAAAPQKYLGNNFGDILLKIKKKRLILTRTPQISGQNKSEAREPEGLVKITYGFFASSLFKRAGNSNYEKILNCALCTFFLTKMQQL